MTSLISIADNYFPSMMYNWLHLSADFPLKQRILFNFNKSWNQFLYFATTYWYLCHWFLPISIWWYNDSELTILYFPFISSLQGWTYYFFHLWFTLTYFCKKNFFHCWCWQWPLGSFPLFLWYRYISKINFGEFDGIEKKKKYNV